MRKLIGFALIGSLALSAGLVTGCAGGYAEEGVYAGPAPAGYVIEPGYYYEPEYYDGYRHYHPRAYYYYDGHHYYHRNAVPPGYAAREAPWHGHEHR